MPNPKPCSNLSIAICTYNRSDQLKLTLASLLKCVDELQAGDEIIVVDNNSIDDTRETINSYSDRLPIAYRFESKQGLSHARNNAISNFSNNLIMFVDDDVTVLPGHIDSYRSALTQHPNYGFFGGRISVDWKYGRPKWLQGDSHPLLNGLFVKYKLSDGAEYLDKHNQLLPYGANFGLKKELINNVGLFNVDLGVSGKSILRGEETEYFYRCLNAGYSGLYLDSAHVEHRLDLKRLGLRYLYKYGQSKGISQLHLEQIEPKRSYLNLVLLVFKSINQLRKGRRDRFYECVINLGIQSAFNQAARDQRQLVQD